MKNLLLPLALAGCVSPLTHADTIIDTHAEIVIRASDGALFNILGQSVFASAASFFIPVGEFCTSCDGLVSVDTDADADISFAEASAYSGAQSCGGSSVRSSSQLYTSPVIISFLGEATGFGAGKRGCENSLYGGGASYGSNVDFEIVNGGETGGTVVYDFTDDTTVGINPNPLTPRTTYAHIVCLDGLSGTTFVYQATVQIGLYFPTTSESSGPSDSGTYSFSSIQITIADSIHDVTGDGRFNIEDATVLQAIVGTPDAFLPMYTSLFDYNQDGEVDQGDVNMVHKFVDAGLSSGLFGDTNRDGVVDCCDLDGYDAAFGSLFYTPNTAYLVELDWDLDGDIDAVDRAQFDSTACISDINNDHTVNFFDTNLFLSLFNAGDLSVDFNEDGTLNFFDVGLFLASSGKSCP